jgi:hypothetical protein
MHDFAMLLKSYGADSELADRLLKSFNTFNSERINLYIVVPESDVNRFERWSSETIEVLPESLLAQHLVDSEVHGIRPGYINQEIIKLSFWELGLAHAYFCIDSDAEFIRPFTVSDFMFDERTPFSVLVEDKDLKAEPGYFAQHWQGRERSIRRIQDLVGLQDPRLLTCHGHQVFSSKVLCSLREDFMASRGWSYRDLLEESPYEFSWYNMWLQKSQMIDIRACEPLVKTFHNENQFLASRLENQTSADLARSYVAVVVNSNFANSWEGLDSRSEASTALASLVSTGTLLRAVGLKIRRRLRLAK